MATPENFTCPLAVPHHVAVDYTTWNNDLKEKYLSGESIDIEGQTITKTDDMVIFIKNYNE